MKHFLALNDDNLEKRPYRILQRLLLLDMVLCKCLSMTALWNILVFNQQQHYNTYNTHTWITHTHIFVSVTVAMFSLLLSLLSSHNPFLSLCNLLSSFSSFSFPTFLKLGVTHKNVLFRVVFSGVCTFHSVFSEKKYHPL